MTSDLFEHWVTETGVVIEHSALGVAADGASRALHVAAGSGLVVRAAALARDALDGLPGEGTVLGALPFDGVADAALRLPQRVLRRDPAPPTRPPQPSWRVRGLLPEPPPTDFEDAVRGALSAIEAGDVEKVVLARTLLVSADGPIDPRAVARRLRAADPDCFVFAVALPGGSTLVGASPELLLRRTGLDVASDPLAGTASRSPDPARDAEVAQELFDAVKERREHRLTAEAVAGALAPFCTSLEVDDEPSLSATATLWHLRTAVRGRLRRDAPDALTLAAALHPTPAVCGTPPARAAELIRGLEPFERRFYAGMVGWVDSRGDGEWAVALRCAEITGSTARLYAGAGIVAGSDPAAEDLETEAKFGTMLRALGVDATRD